MEEQSAIKERTQEERVKLATAQEERELNNEVPYRKGKDSYWGALLKIAIEMSYDEILTSLGQFMFQQYRYLRLNT